MELRAEPLAIEVVAPLDRVALLDRAERRGILGELVHPQRQRLAPPRADIEEGPPVRRRVGQPDVESPLRAAVHEHGDLADRRAAADRKIEVALRR